MSSSGASNISGQLSRFLGCVLVALLGVAILAKAPVSGQERDVAPASEPGNNDALAPLKRGIIDFASGSRYEGELQNGKMHGFGIFNYSNGDKYEGHFFKRPDGRHWKIIVFKWRSLRRCIC